MIDFGWTIGLDDGDDDEDDDDDGGDSAEDDGCKLGSMIGILFSILLLLAYTWSTCIVLLSLATADVKVKEFDCIE